MQVGLLVHGDKFKKGGNRRCDTNAVTDKLREGQCDDRLGTRRV